MDGQGSQGVRCVGFDVDGTLYDQRRLRRRMAWQLARGLLAGRLSWRGIRTLRAYRHLTELLRQGDADRGVGLARRHLLRAAVRVGVPVATVASVVHQWMSEAPLPLLDRCRWPDVHATLARLRESGLRLGVLSDYPAAEKLQALGLAGCFDAVLSCQDPASDGYKPAGNGFRRLADALGVRPEACVYVGDRLDVDVEGAVAAGMRAIWFSPYRTRTDASGSRVLRVRCFADIGRILC